MRYVFVILTLLFASFTAFADEGQGTFTQHFKDSMFQITKNSEFSVEIIVNRKKLKVGYNKAKIVVHDKNDRDIEGAVITIVPWMPDMGHGVKAKPVITEKGKGLYQAENIEFSMSGFWEWRITVKKGEVEDTAVFEFPDIQSKKKFY